MKGGCVFCCSSCINFNPTSHLNASLGSPEKKTSINFTKTNRNFCLILHCNADNSYLFVSGNEIIKFKTDNKNINFPTWFCLGSISDWFSATEFREVSSNENVYGLSVDYNSLDNSDKHSQVFND